MVRDLDAAVEVASEARWGERTWRWSYGRRSFERAEKMTMIVLCNDRDERANCLFFSKRITICLDAAVKRK